jgi:hypothetical protein
MKLSNLNEYIQTIAALGAILPLVAVGYERIDAVAATIE